jgi:hypothetical protein
MHPNLSNQAANDATFVTQARERTVPIPSSITPVPGYPRKLVVYKIAASKYWQVRCWVAGRTHRRSTQTQSLRMAQTFARQFYEQLLAQSYTAQIKTSANTATVEHTPKVKPQHTFAAIAA